MSATLKRGDSKYFRYVLTRPGTRPNPDEPSGPGNLDLPFNLTGCEVFVTMKSSLGDVDALSVYEHQMVITSAGVVTNAIGLSLEKLATDGVVIQRISPEESMLFVAGTYNVDLQVRDTASDVWTPFQVADEIVIEDVTRRIKVV